MTLNEMRQAQRAGRVSSLELTREALQRAAASQLNAFITLTEEAALATARARDRELAQGIDRGPFHGIPIAHKDCLFTKGVRTTWGSKLFSDFVPDRDGDAVHALADAGAVSIGKTNLHELTYGMTSSNPHFGAVHNPRDVARVPGGSSGGSAAAVADGIVPMATGTDTGGSIRIPASFCGVVGFKPTFDAISRTGCFPLGLTLDHIGPMARTVPDAALAFRAMCGNRNPLFERASLAGVRIGLPQRFFFDHVDAIVRAAVRGAAHAAERAGATLAEVDPGNGADLNAVGRVIQLAEAASVLERYAHRREDFGTDVMALIDQGRMLPATAYLSAQRARRRLADEFASVWQHCDVLLVPATPMVAPKIGQTMVEIEGESEDVRTAGTRLTRPINVLGWPTVALPCGTSPEGLPIGLQCIGPTGSDERTLSLAAGLEILLA